MAGELAGHRGVSRITISGDHALTTRRRAENLMLVESSGRGKSSLRRGDLPRAIDHDLRGSWFSLESLTADVGRSKVDASTGKLVDRIICSEAEALYRLIDAAYERRSLILTGNFHPARFYTVVPEGLGTATVPPAAAPRPRHRPRDGRTGWARRTTVVAWTARIHLRRSLPQRDESKAAKIS